MNRNNKYLMATYLMQAQSSSPILSSFTPTTSLKGREKYILLYTMAYLIYILQKCITQHKGKASITTMETSSTWISCTFGCLWRKFSISVGYIFSPPRITMSYKKCLPLCLHAINKTEKKNSRTLNIGYWL